MALIYPVLADAPEPEEGSEPDFAELAADLSDQWLVEVAVGEDGDDACFGPLAARMAWDLAVEIVDKRPGVDGVGRAALRRRAGRHDHRAVRGRLRCCVRGRRGPARRATGRRPAAGAAARLGEKNGSWALRVSRPACCAYGRRGVHAVGDRVVEEQLTGEHGRPVEVHLEVQVRGAGRVPAGVDGRELHRRRRRRSTWVPRRKRSGVGRRRFLVPVLVRARRAARPGPARRPAKPGVDALARRTARGRRPRSPRGCRRRRARPGRRGRSGVPGRPSRMSLRTACASNQVGPAMVSGVRGQVPAPSSRSTGRAAGERPTCGTGGRRRARARCVAVRAAGRCRPRAPRPGRSARRRPGRSGGRVSHRSPAALAPLGRGAAARRRASCPCRGRGRPRSRRAASPNSRSSTSSIRLANRAASCCVLPTPPGNRLSPVKTWTPASSGPRQTSAMLPGVCPRRWITSSVCPPTVTVSPCSTGPRAPAPAGRRRRRRARRSSRRSPRRPRGSARWWSQCPCVVTTVRSVGVADQRAQRLRLGGRVDQQRLAARGVAQQVGVVRHLAHGELADGQAGQFAHVAPGRRPRRRRCTARRSSRTPIGKCRRPPLRSSAWTLAELPTLLRLAVGTVGLPATEIARLRALRRGDGGRRRPRPPGPHRRGRRADRRLPGRPPRGRARRGARRRHRAHPVRAAAGRRADRGQGQRRRRRRGLHRRVAGRQRPPRDRATTRSSPGCARPARSSSASPGCPSCASTARPTARAR